jgi:MerR family transcriptional regulator, thiopeptide resistance regulator
MTMEGRVAAVPSSDARVSSGRPLAVVGISHLARLTGVTVRALRHYEDLGLLDPVRTKTGERRFPPDQCERASFIALLRRCDVALDEVRDILDDPDEHARSDRFRAALEARISMLGDQLKTVQAALASVDLQQSRRAA